MARPYRPSLVRGMGHLILIILAFLTVAPFYWMAASSLKTNEEFYTQPQPYYPKEISFTGYTDLFIWAGFGRSVINSLIVATSTALATVLISILGAYSLARFRFRGKVITMNVLIMTQMFPGIATLLPLMVIFVTFGLIDTLMGLMLTYTAHIITFTTWLMMGFYDGVPVELEEAATIDGATRLQAVFRVVLPLMIPGLITVFLLAWTAAWGELQTAVLFTRTDASKTVPVGLTIAIAGAAAAGVGQMDYQLLYAGATVLTIPPVLIFLFLQKYFTPGMTLGALKR